MATGFIVLFVLLACGRPPEDPETRAQRLGKGLRCPVCRGVPIVESPAELAQQMMEIVRDQIAKGKSDEEILQYFEERYGEWALLQPKPEGLNLVVWVLPAIFLIGGGVLIFRRSRKP